MSNVTIHYWGGVKSRTFYGNVFLAATGHLGKVKLETEYGYPHTDEFKALKNLDKKSGWGLMPFLVDEDTGAKIGESMAIVRYLSRKFGEDPVNLAEFALCQQNLDWVGGTHNMLSGANYAPDKVAAYNGLFANQLPKSLAGLETTFVNPDGPWFSSKPNAGDYAVAGMLQIIMDLERQVNESDSLIAKYPRLAKLHATVFANEAVQEYAKTVPYDYFKRTVEEKKP